MRQRTDSCYWRFTISNDGISDIGVQNLAGRNICPGRAAKVCTSRAKLSTNLYSINKSGFMNEIPASNHDTATLNKRSNDNTNRHVPLVHGKIVCHKYHIL